jgi:hypothetical protein
VVQLGSGPKPSPCVNGERGSERPGIRREPIEVPWSDCVVGGRAQLRVAGQQVADDEGLDV